MKKIISSALAAVMMLGGTAFAANPIIKSDDSGRVYGGDPAAFVDDDGTVYLYIGNDQGDGSYYNMPKYLCYSSTDLLNWKYEGVPITAGDFKWGSANDAWASQVIKNNGKYYFYNSKNSTGISVAVSDSPTGPFVNALGDYEKLIYPSWTQGKVGWDDIDPTVWIEDDENGVQHRYLCWGNSNIYMVELNEDMISIVDKNGDGTINGSDITELTINNIPENSQYTEAPWIYKRNGLYYIFFASNWREDLSYATSENIWGPYEYGGLVMNVGASSNTNHPAVIDFNGETYLFYHTGALANGGGYLRSVCIDKLVFDENGGVAQLEESSVGLDGNAVKITYGGEAIFHTHLENSHGDTKSLDYPMGATMKVGGNSLYETDSLWEIVPADDDESVYIQSVNKMGYYITNYEGYAKLLHDDDDTSASLAARTFIMKEVGGKVTFESASERGKYLAVKNGRIALLSEPDLFEIEEGRVNGEVTASEDDGKIVISAVGVANSTAVIIIKNEGKTEIGYGATDSEGNLSYSFTPTQNGEYEIYCLGKSVKVNFGGAQ
jgi:hypothetical protein